MPTSDTGRRAGTTARIAVVVVRTGGIAGMRKEWKAEPPPKMAAEWESLLDDCPWDEAPETSGADRFVWSVRARRGGEECEVRLGDGQVTGPWRTLVDAVRDFADRR